MSDIMIHICSTDDTSQGGHPPGKAKKKRKPFHKKMQYLQAKGYLKGKQNNNFFKKRDQTPHQSRTYTEHSPPPTATQTKSLPHLSAGASHSDSGPSTSFFNLKPLVNRAKSKGGFENPKGSVNPKTTAVSSRPSVSGSHRPTATSVSNPTKYLAIDCEMVGSGPKGSINQLARCSIVSYDGDLVFDKFIKPNMPVTDYRTRWSGIRPRDLVTATPYAEARKEILRLLMGKVVIGHAIHNDFKALSYTHPPGQTRDTSRIPLLNRKAGFAEKECASLKRLTKAIFNRDIQVGKKGHSSVEDARATMELYKVVEEEWERTLLSRSLAN